MVESAALSTIERDKYFYLQWYWRFDQNR